MARFSIDVKTSVVDGMYVVEADFKGRPDYHLKRTIPKNTFEMHGQKAVERVIADMCSEMAGAVWRKYFVDRVDDADITK